MDWWIDRAATLPPYITINDHRYYTAAYDLPTDAELEEHGGDWDLYYVPQLGYHYSEREDGKQMKKEGCMWIELSRHCMVDSSDHHGWHMMFLKHRMVDNLDHHGCYSLSL